ncbi:unnamed protein product [marine sediment metagenome]|uniref:Uncharacterized protein n=1 Tax=marine sediment metagenome TaxID=412755 RepID=X0VFZ5_9ZZZZ
MPAKPTFFRQVGAVNLLSDRDWITIISALLQDTSASSQRLANKLLRRTKHGRQIRLMRLIYNQRPRHSQMQKALKVSRRTVFRYLNGLEDYGVRFRIDERFPYRYEITHLPEGLKKLM